MGSRLLPVTVACVASLQQGGGSHTGSIVLGSVPEPATGSLLALALSAATAGTRPRRRPSR